MFNNIVKELEEGILTCVNQFSTFCIIPVLHFCHDHNGNMILKSIDWLLPACHFGRDCQHKLSPLSNWVGQLLLLNVFFFARV